MRPSSTGLRCLLAAAACLAAVTGVAGCDDPTTARLPVPPASYGSCPSGQHWVTVPFGTWKCSR